MLFKPVVFLSLLLTLLASCSSSGLQTTPTTIIRDPFLTQWKNDASSRELSLEGPSRVLPGENVPYTLRLSNNGSDTWNEHYCVFLLNKEGWVNQVTQGSIDIAPGDRKDVPFQVDFPSSLKTGPYGLALVIPGNMQTMTTLHVGSDEPLPPGQWPAFDCPVP